MPSEEILPAEETSEAPFAVAHRRTAPSRNVVDAPVSNDDRRLKVVQFNTNRRWGGGEQQVLDLMCGGAKQGIDSTLLASPRGELYRRAGLDPTCSRIAFDLRSRYNPFALIRLCRILRKCKADVLHLHDSQAIALGVPAATILGLRVVLHRRISSPIRRNPCSLRVYRARCIEAYIAVSESARRTLLDLPVAIERTRLIPSGVNTYQIMPSAERFELRRSLDMEETTWIGTVGSLDPKKDIETFIRTAALLAVTHPEWRYLVVGKGPEQARLERVTSELGLTSKVRFTGHVKDAHRYTAALDAFVFPSLREGSPGAIKEAMSLGIPVIAANSPGTTEVVRPGTGKLALQRDSEAFAAAIESVFAQPTATREMIERARHHVAECFPIRRTIDETVSLYRLLGCARPVRITAS